MQLDRAGVGRIADHREHLPEAAGFGLGHKPREQRNAAELKRDITDVLLAHNSRSENLRNVLVGARSGS